MQEKKSTIEMILENRRQKNSLGGAVAVLDAPEAEKKFSGDEIQREKKFSAEISATTAAITNNVARPCHTCNCPQFWLSIYDATSLHCECCEPPPAESIVKSRRSVIVDPGASCGDRYRWTNVEWRNGKAQHTPWRDNAGGCEAGEAGERDDGREWADATAKTGEVIYLRLPASLADAWRARIMQRLGVAETWQLLTQAAVRYLDKVAPIPKNKPNTLDLSSDFAKILDEL